MSARCLFCEIVAGRAPASMVYQDDATIAFMDLFPVHPGHLLVVPRIHVRDLLDCPPDVAGQLFAASARLAPAVVAATGADGFNVWTANGKAAGQEIFHLHLHILPRFDDDTFGLRFPKDYPREAARAELNRMAERISAKM